MGDGGFLWGTRQVPTAGKRRPTRSASVSATQAFKGRGGREASEAASEEGWAEWHLNLGQLSTDSEVPFHPYLFLEKFTALRTDIVQHWPPFHGYHGRLNF